MKKAKIMVIGIGPHARRIYVPSILRLAKKYPVELCVGVDLESSKDTIEGYLSKQNIALEMHYVDTVDKSGNLSKQTVNSLDGIIKSKQINGVIIATDPLTHKSYANWALSRNLNILMDKPITSRRNVTTARSQAVGIFSDYKDLLKKYKRLQTKQSTIFSINTQRRYEVGYKKVMELIREVALKFNAPITSIQAMHSDGVWIFPDEIVEQTVHPYSRGYGKCSHSGYHLFDIIWQFYKAGKINDKFANRGEAFTSFLMPTGLLKQFTHQDYERYFGNKYNEVKRRSVKELNNAYKTYGEIDAFSVIRFLQNKTNVCNVSINLLHNSFSRRSWVKPAKDLYKGNGRVKHQYYFIQQGPFQCIQIHNYQSNSVQNSQTEKDYELGGDNHFDIYVFRNKKMFGNIKTVQRLSLRDLKREGKIKAGRLYHEQAKDLVIIEFINFIVGKINKRDLVSNIDSHEEAVKIMSSIYQSHISQTTEGNPISRFKL